MVEIYKLRLPVQYEAKCKLDLFSRQIVKNNNLAAFISHRKINSGCLQGLVSDEKHGTLLNFYTVLKNQDGKY